MCFSRVWFLAIAASLFLICGSLSSARASNFSFTGAFSQDDNLQLFTFTTSAPGIVTFRTWSYAGGTNAAGLLVLRGGFDPNLALFNSGGFFLIQNDNGGASVSPDALTGQRWDSLQLINLPAGTWTLALTESGNFAVGPMLSSGFSRTGQGNFTASRDARCLTGQFVDASNSFPGDCRDGHWAVDILNVSSAQQLGTVPEPATMLLMGTGLAATGMIIRRRRRRK